MFKITSTTADDVAALREAHMASLAAPLDGMWEAFAAAAAHYAIHSETERLGYFCVNEEGQVLQFHLAPTSCTDAPSVFSEVVAHDDVRGAIVSTAEPVFLGLCLDHLKRTQVHTVLYEDHVRGEVAPPTLGELQLDVVEADELEAVADFERGCLDWDPGDWLAGYLKNLVARGELYAFRSGEELVAIGEVRKSDTQKPYADLGVMVARRHRGTGIASYVLWRLKDLCYDRSWKPICSTGVENIGAQRAIARVGFISRYRLLEIAFEEEAE